MSEWVHLGVKLTGGDVKTLSRAISLVENEKEGYQSFLKQLSLNTQCHILGITGPPGAGKSTLTDCLIKHYVNEGKKVGVLCIDPSSPFNYGSILGDRIRMQGWYNNDQVFIRSLATRGSLGGLHPKIIEITDLIKAAGFDEIIIETVGVGQSEVEISGVADTTIVVLVPESGDEIQTMKAGLMEIADIFVVNKADRESADQFVNNLLLMLAPSFNKKNKISVLKTVANKAEGINELGAEILRVKMLNHHSENKLWLLAHKIFLLIQKEKMGNINEEMIRISLKDHVNKPDFNTYLFAEKYFS
ncbi:MAG: hypothetical protein NVSMB45_05310 [Ginsengibacter sp.]